MSISPTIEATFLEMIFMEDFLIDAQSVHSLKFTLHESRQSQSDQSQTYNIIDGIEHFKIHSNIMLTSIGSEPVRICFCNKSGHPDCDHKLPPIQKKREKCLKYH